MSEEQPPTTESDMANAPSEAHEEMEANDPQMEDTEDTTDKTKVKDSWFVPVYVTCKLCSGPYKFPVKTTCGSDCKANACKACALKQISKLKKCWNTDCEKPVTSDSLVSDKEQEEVMAKWYVRMKQWDENRRTGKLLRCSLCSNICQDGVSTPCCGTVACRVCAAIKIASQGECWFRPCSAPDMTSEKLVNDELLRKAVGHFKENGLVDDVHAKEISAKRSELRKAIFAKNKNDRKNGEANKNRRQPPSHWDAPYNKKNNKSFNSQRWNNGPRRGLGPNRGGHGYGPRNWQSMGGHGGPPFHGNGMGGRGGPPFHGNGMGGNNMYLQNLERQNTQMKMMLMNGGGMGMNGGGMGMNGEGIGGMGMGGGMGMNEEGMGGGRGMGMRGGGRGMEESSGNLPPFFSRH